MDDALLPTANVYGTNNYISCLRVLWCVRLLDFLQLSMILPTLNGLLEALGGNVTYYYAALFLYTALLIVLRSQVGKYVDKTHSVWFLYKLLVPMAIFGNIFYAFSPSFGSPVVVVLARTSCALGASTENLMFFYMNLVAKPPEKRTWATYIATTRSLGYLGGPVFASWLLLIYPHAVSITGAGLTSNSHLSLWDWTNWQSPLGPFGLVGLVLALANACVFLTLNVVWKPPPEKPMPRPVQSHSHDSGSKLPEGMEVSAFVRHWAVVAVIVGNTMGCFLGLGFETIVPPTTSSILGWGPDLARYNGLIYTAIGGSLLLGQLGVTVTSRNFHDRVSDGACFLFGLAGMSIGCAFIAVMWGSIVPGDYTDPFGKDYMVLLHFMGPPVVVAFFMPWCMNSSVALFMRLGNHSLGAKLGRAQAIQMNCTSLATLLSPVYQFFTYPSSMQQSAQAPVLSLGLSAALGFIALFVGIAAKPYWGTH